MKKSILTLFLLCFSLNSYSGIDPYWYWMPEDGPMPAMPESSNEKLGRLLSALDKVHENSALKLDKKEKRWGLKTIRTNLALGLSGSIGVKTWGGTKTLQLLWERKPEKKIEGEKPNASLPTLTLDETSDAEDVYNQSSAIARALTESGRVQNYTGVRDQLYRKGAEILDLSKSLSRHPFHKFFVHTIRTDLVVSGSGQVSSFLLKVGGEIRIRLEFVRIYKDDDPVEGLFDKFKHWRISRKGEKFDIFTKNLLGHLDDLEIENLDHPSFFLKELRFGISFSAGGDVGVAKLSGGPGFFIFLRKKKEYLPNHGPLEFDNEVAPLNLLVDEVEEKHFQYARENNIPFQVQGGDKDDSLSQVIFRLHKRKTKKGLKKAVKFGNFFLGFFENKISNIKKWGLYQVRPGYEFSIGGVSGPVTLRGRQSMEMIFQNKAY